MSAPTSQLATSSETIGYRLQAVAIAFLVIEVCAVALRYYCRYIKGTRPGLDDYLVLPAFVFNVGLCGIAMSQRRDIGHHLLWVQKNAPASLVLFAKLQVAFEICYVLAFTFPKLAILGLYLRIFVEKAHRIPTYILIGLVTATGISELVAICVQCTPLAYIWDKVGNPGGHCIDSNLLWRWASLPNVIIDAVMLVLPIPCVWKLKLSKKDRFGLVLTFLTGGVGIITCLIRMLILFHTDGETDSTWEAVLVGSLTIVEAGVYLLAACLPIYRSVFVSVRKRIAATLSSSLGSKGTQLDGETELILMGSDKKVFGNGSHTGFERLNNDRAPQVTSSNGPGFGGSSYTHDAAAEVGRYRNSGTQVKQDFTVATSNAEVRRLAGGK